MFISRSYAMDRMTLNIYFLSCSYAIDRMTLNVYFLSRSYAIDRRTDPHRQFSIDSEGLVMTAKMLDRETEQTHRVYILAIDHGKY